MISEERVQQIIKENRYIIMSRSLFKIQGRYYSEMGVNCYDMDLLGNLLSYLYTEYKTYDDIVRALKNENYICGVNDLEHYLGEYLSASKKIAISGGYPDFMDQKYFEGLYPEEKEKDFLEYTYSIPLDNFLELAKKMIDFFHAHVLWIVIYEDKHGKIHLEKYDKNLDSLKDGIPFIDDRILKS